MSGSWSAVLVMREAHIRLRDDKQVAVVTRCQGLQRDVMLEKSFEGCVGVFLVDKERIERYSR